MKNSKELIALLNLKDLGDHNFSGNSVTIGSPHVFGGQVLAQAVNAAYRTIPENITLFTFLFLRSRRFNNSNKL